MACAHKDSKTKMQYGLIAALFLSSCAETQQESDNLPATCAPTDLAVYTLIDAPTETGLTSFLISTTEITNKQFAVFVEETGYVTDAQRAQPPQGGGGAVFVVPSSPIEPWWAYAPEANWLSPDGAENTIRGRDDDPVVQVSYRDAVAYARWAGGRLPTEAEWEFAAGGGAETKYAWGDTKTINGKQQANTWQGFFPIENSNEDGFLRRAPVGCFPPNAFGLYDMIGNVWEWTASPVRASRGHENIIKGGSFLCADNYCQRYTVPAREKHEVDFSTNHIGFRIVKRPTDPKDG